jgi:cytochrome c biogenesis protein CcmG, thiol:disulfide interchange protein DsbE
MRPSLLVLRIMTRPLAPSPRALVCAGAIGLFGCSTRLPPSIDHPLVGYESPAFQETAIDDRPVIVPGYQSTKVTVIDFWASWCGSCMDTMPALERLWRDKRDEGLVVVGVSVDDGPRDALRGAYAFGLSFPIVHDASHRLASEYGVYQVPTTFVVDSAGMVRYVGRDPASIRLAVAALMDR